MADIQQLIEADKALLLSLNGSDSLFWDGFMWVATSTIVWVPVAAMLLYIIIKNNKIKIYYFFNLIKLNFFYKFKFFI